MQDTIINGTGNSRALRMPPNTLTVYPSWDAFVTGATSQLGVPVDLLGPDPAGCEQIGDSLNKANLLKDATAALYGLTSEAVPDEVLSKARQLIQTAQSTANLAQSTANTSAKIEQGTVTPASTSFTPIVFSQIPRFVIFGSTGSANLLGFWAYPASKWVHARGSGGSPAFDWDNIRVSGTTIEPNNMIAGQVHFYTAIR